MDSMEFHRKYRGKISVESKVPVTNIEELSAAYTPGVAKPCLEIQKNPDLVWELTNKWNSVAVVTDGTAILGLGDIGADAAVPLAEGKCVLFKKFANIDAFPICLKTKEPDEIVDIVDNISPVFGGINLEDISAPRCFEVEKRLQERLDIPVFHDDQHGTAVVVLGAFLNALKIVDKKIGDVKIAMNGAGAAGIAVAKILLDAGAKNIILCDSRGIVSQEREDLNPAKAEMSKLTNPEGVSGGLKDAINSSDAFIGLSVANQVDVDMVKSMADNSIVFAMANPDPEIMPEDAKKGGAKVVATGRSDLPNQVNNALGFPGIFRGALDVRANRITEGMKVAAAEGIASLIEEPEPDKFIPSPLDPKVVPAVAKCVSESAKKDGVSRI